MISGCSGSSEKCRRLTDICWLSGGQLSFSVLSNRGHTYRDHHTVWGAHSNMQQPLTADRNGATKGVIPYNPSNNDQLVDRIVALLDPTQARPTADGAEATNAASASTGATPSGDDETSSRLSPESLLPEARDPSRPLRTPVTPSTPLSESSEREDQREANDGNSSIEAVSRQVSSRPANSDPVMPSTNASQTINPPPTSTPRQDWTRVQRERERQQREERERIKAQIKHDHAERRRIDELRRQPAMDLTSTDSTHSSPNRVGSSQIRVQVRTFDGSTLRSTFPKTVSISSQVRPWIDSSAGEKIPYDLKIVLTPRPNRTIETAEEEKSLEDLDIIGSCTLIMVPVKGYVESYSPSSSGILGSAVSGGYNLVSGSVGAVLGGVRSVLGFGQVTPESSRQGAAEEPSTEPPPGQVRVRTLADQRREAQKKDQQFYNGNQLNFQPRKEDEDGDKD
jgi:UBX domain